METDRTEADQETGTEQTRIQKQQGPVLPAKPEPPCMAAETILTAVP